MFAHASFRLALPWLLPLLLVGCGSSPVAEAAAAQPSPASSLSASSPALPAATAPDASPSPHPEATPTATLLPQPPPAQPDFLFVSFAGLAPGTYPVHLHRICNGGQGFHIAYLPFLSVSAAGAGGIAVPAGDFGRSLCLVVYATRAQTSVASYRPI